MSAHSVPLHCPYCAGEQLHPHGDTHGGWECRECLRVFAVKLLGLLSPGQVGAVQVGAPTGGGDDDHR